MLYRQGDRTCNSDKMRELKLTEWEYKPWQPTGNKLLLICIAVHVFFWLVLSEYASPNIRLQAWCLHYNWAWSTGHHKWGALHHFPWHAALQALSTGKWKGKLAWVWREAEAIEKESWELQDQVLVQICQRHLAWRHVNPSDWQTLNTVQQTSQNLFVQRSTT